MGQEPKAEHAEQAKALRCRDCGATSPSTTCDVTGFACVSVSREGQPEKDLGTHGAEAEFPGCTEIQPGVWVLDNQCAGCGKELHCFIVSTRNGRYHPECADKLPPVPLSVPEQGAQIEQARINSLQWAEARWRCKCERLNRMGATYCRCGDARTPTTEIVMVIPVQVVPEQGAHEIGNLKFPDAAEPCLSIATVCGGNQARICPKTGKEHDMSAVIRFKDGGSVACKDCGVTAMSLDLMELP